MRRTARVPATSANLGPGFDCFGLALELCNEVTIDTDAEPGVSWEGEGSDELPTDGTDLVSRAIAAATKRQVAELGGAALPPFALHGVNRIPLERGLGSSSAAVVAGVALSKALRPDGADPSATFAQAAAIEGHPDNAAAAVFGGLTVVADGHVRRFDVASSVRPMLLIPEARIATAGARGALPETVPLPDAVFNVAHGALVIHALTIGDLDLLRVALRDRLHQDARLALVPSVREVFEELDRHLFPVCVSGAGPTLVVFERDDPVPAPGTGWRVLRLPVRAAGVEILDG